MHIFITVTQAIFIILHLIFFSFLKFHLIVFYISSVFVGM
jgi:hypothetical protein